MQQDDPRSRARRVLLFANSTNAISPATWAWRGVDVQSGLREDIAIVVMSATLDGERLARCWMRRGCSSAGAAIQ